MNLIIINSCCGNPSCTKHGVVLAKLADDKCDNCGQECRNCPPSKGDYTEEYILTKMVISAQHAQKSGAGDDDRSLNESM